MLKTLLALALTLLAGLFAIGSESMIYGKKERAGKTKKS